MKIAIFGGSFNPVHMGHYKIVRYLEKHYDFQKIYVVPAYQNPLKKEPPALPESVRWEMLEKTFNDIETVELSNIELVQKGISYSYQTLLYFKKQFPNSQCYLILGEDSYSCFHLWTKADTILKNAQLLVFPRPATENEQNIILIPDLVQKTKWIHVNIPAISATEIRQMDLKQIEKNAWLHPNALKIWKQYKLNH